MLTGSSIKAILLMEKCKDSVKWFLKMEIDIKDNLEQIIRGVKAEWSWEMGKFKQVSGREEILLNNYEIDNLFLFY